jgi:ribosomal protein RSM22 (predicted rRNA methylase)
MLDLLANPDVQKLLGLGAGCGTALGFALKWLLPSFKKVIAGDVSRAEKELQAALRAEAEAKKTASKDDDVAAHNAAVAAKKVLVAKQRLLEAVSAVPAGE